MGIWVRVCCDRCGYLLPGLKNRQIPTLADLEKLAENQGWLIRNHSIYCPLCRAKYELLKSEGGERCV